MIFIKTCAFFIIIKAIGIAGNINETTNDNFCMIEVFETTDDGIQYPRLVPVCCDNYYHNGTVCKPMCSSCTNGDCVAPNVCKCNEGFQMKNKFCLPHCKDKCLNGFCSRPGICKCLSGYELDVNNSTNCKPICQPKCSDVSTCIKPNQCQCNEGYTWSNVSTQCMPICKDKCINGVCSQPGICSCYQGYELKANSTTICQPICEPKCPEFSTCVKPHECQCNTEFIENQSTHQCEPRCKDMPKNSKCIESSNTWECNDQFKHDYQIEKCILKSCKCPHPKGYCLENEDHCECYNGFKKNSTSGQCEPTCEPNCINSICMANNVCQCLDDYHPHTLKPNVCERNNECNETPCENGECLVTGECKCKTGYIKSLTYYGKIQCDPVATFIAKLMLIVIGVPLILVCSVLIIFCIIAKKRTYKIEESDFAESEIQYFSDNNEKIPL